MIPKYKPTLAERVITALNVDSPAAKDLQEEFRPKWRAGRLSITEALAFLDRIEALSAAQEERR
jgi:hypothetical protein